MPRMTEYRATLLSRPASALAASACAILCQPCLCCRSGALVVRVQQAASEQRSAGGLGALHLAGQRLAWSRRLARAGCRPPG